MAAKAAGAEITSLSRYMYTVYATQIETCSGVKRWRNLLQLNKFSSLIIVATLFLQALAFLIPG